MSKCILVLGVAAALAFGLGGFKQPAGADEAGPKVLSSMKRASHTATQTAEARHVAGKSLDIRTDNGAIVATKYDGSVVKIKAEVRAVSAERLSATQIVVTRAEDESLRVRVQWPNNERYGSEGCTIEVQVPDTDGLSLRTSNGRITATGLGGAAVLRSSNGRVNVERHAGSVNIETSNGAVELRSVEGASVKSSNGSVTIDGAAGPVTVATSNGGVNVKLAKENAGPFSLSTSNASVTASVGPAFAGRVEATTSNGRVVIRDAAGEQSFRGRGFVVSAGEGEPSRIRTSNGSVRIEMEGRATIKSASKP